MVLTTSSLVLLLTHASFAVAPAAERESVSGEPLKMSSERTTKDSFGTGWGLGASAGITSGFGLSTRKHFGNRLGFQLTGIYLPLEREHWASLGAQGYFTILRGGLTRFYALAGTQLMISGYTARQSQIYGSGAYTTPPSASWDYHLFPGVGLGLEFHITRSLGWSIELPLSARVRLESPAPDASWRDNITLIPAANTAVFFYFR